MSLERQLPRFLVAGTIGFAVDAGVLYAALALGADYYSGRLVSFCLAVATTWLINRRWTFEHHRVRPSLAEFSRYFGAMLLGGAVNYASYALIVATLPRTPWLPLVAVAAGSIAGLGVNFTSARLWVFRTDRARTARPAAEPETTQPERSSGPSSD
ncbi:MAG TPA: GtrA family protein [Xanthomonadales bacterium]|nr:GtrA family protein [Xanthomonadales bacterium]